MIKNLSKKYKVFLFILGIELILFFIHPDLSMQAWSNSLQFSLNVIGILPPVILLLGLLETWLPARTIETYLGKQSGTKGMFLATFLGSVAAGPLFTAFPVAASFANKGGRVANIVIFLGAWATIKVPMLMMESHFLGIKFSLLRLAITLPFIIMIGLLMENLFPTPRDGDAPVTSLDSL